MSLYRSGVGASWRDRQVALLLPFLPRLAVDFPCLLDALLCATAGALGRALEAFAPVLEREALLVLLRGFFSAAVCAGTVTTSAQASPATATIRKIKSPAKKVKGQINDLPLCQAMRLLPGRRQRARHERGRPLLLLIAAARAHDLEDHGVARFQRVLNALQLLGRSHRLAVDLHDDVVLQQPDIIRERAPLHLRDEDARRTVIVQIL